MWDGPGYLVYGSRGPIAHSTTPNAILIGTYFVSTSIFHPNTQPTLSSASHSDHRPEITVSPLEACPNQQ